MDIELGKKLKKAGFTGTRSWLIEGEGDNQVEIPIPELFEIMEDLGDTLFKLQKCRDKEGKIYWIAKRTSNKQSRLNSVLEDSAHKAMVNLWIKIKESENGYDNSKKDDYRACN